MPSQPHLLAGCMLELRWAMEPYITFSDDAILEGATPWERSLEGQTRAIIPRKTQLAPVGEPTDETDPMEEPTEEPMAMKVSTSKPAGELDTPPVWHEDKGKGEVPHSDYPGWREVLHPAQSAISAREIPPPTGELGWRCCSQSVGGGEPDIGEQRSADKLSRKDLVLNHHQGPLNLCPRLQHPQALRELWPAYWGNHPHWLSLKPPLK